MGKLSAEHVIFAADLNAVPEVDAKIGAPVTLVMP